MRPIATSHVAWSPCLCFFCVLQKQLNRSKCRLRSNEPCIGWESISDESIRRQDGGQDSDGAFCRITFNTYYGSTSIDVNNRLYVNPKMNSCNNVTRLYSVLRGYCQCIIFPKALHIMRRRSNEETAQSLKKYHLAIVKGHNMALRRSVI